MGYYERMAKKCYGHCNPNLLKKAIDSGILIDNRLKIEYTKGGHTNSFFDVIVYLKYFSFEALTNIGYYERNFQHRGQTSRKRN